MPRATSSAACPTDARRVTTDHAALASAERAGMFARRKARTAQREYLRRRRFCLASTSCLSLQQPGRRLPARRLPAETDRRACLAGAAGAIASVVIIQTGTGPTMAGELAEQWTVEELKELLEHGHRLVNHVVIDGRGDADHVLVGPAGLFVLETKWSATPYRSDDPRLADTVGRLSGVPRTRGCSSSASASRL